MKYIYIIIILIITIPIGRINFKLHSEKLTHSEKKKDIILQLNFIESELKENNLGSRMQSIFPEGYIFINVLYGLSWCELALADSAKDTELQQRAI